MTSESSADLLAEIVVTMLVALAIDSVAAWALMHGLNGLHLKASFWPCFWVVMAVSIAAKGGGKK